jgi:SAM-dependent methyltransferase
MVEQDMRPEFDRYARGYSAGMDNPIKALLGGSADDYVAVKLRWLRRRIPWLGVDDDRDILDYGCGVGTLMRLMAETGIGARLWGSDVSAGMLEEASALWPATLEHRRPSLSRQSGEKLPLPDQAFDLIVISAVLHHIAPAERCRTYRELARLLRPGGTIIVFEHNPRNPLTRYVVTRTPIDKDAILLPPSEVRQGLELAGRFHITTRYLLFLPPRLAMADIFDRYAWWIPFGGQYAIEARSAATTVG